MSLATAVLDAPGQCTFLEPAALARLKPSAAFHPTRFIPESEDPLDCSLIQLEMPPGWQKSAEDKTAEEHREMVRRGHALNAGMSMPLPRKIDFSLRAIDRALKVNPSWAVSFSAGRDSTVLSHLITEVFGAKIPHVMVNTRMERPEVLRQAGIWRARLAQQGTQLHTVFPELHPGEVWKQTGFPIWSKVIASKVRQFQATGNEAHLKQIPESLHPKIRELTAAGVLVTDQCCDRLKKDPLHAFDDAHGVGGHFVGVRAEEARNRRMSFIQQGALYYATRHQQWICNPLIHWRREDVDTYVSALSRPFALRAG
jgi:3'-phosphoadenosine 5'-phosphosulfate sulfotransferase (PAPS reductase)/FAD synthetase